MPKMKSNRSACKRFHVTGSGKVSRRRNTMRHKLTHKSSKQKRHLSTEAILNQPDGARIKRLIFV